MRVIIHAHAFQHGLSEEQVRVAFDTGSSEARIRRRDAESDPPRWGVVGFDNEARPVELVAVDVMGGDVLIIHARYLSRGFADEMRKAR